MSDLKTNIISAKEFFGKDYERINFIRKLFNGKVVKAERRNSNGKDNKNI